MSLWNFVLFCSLSIFSAYSLIHNVSLKNVGKEKVTLTSFGLLINGIQSFEIRNLSPKLSIDDNTIDKYVLAIQMTKTGADFPGTISDGSSACRMSEIKQSDRESTIYLNITKTQRGRFSILVKCPNKLRDIVLTSDFMHSLENTSVNRLSCNQTYSYKEPYIKFNYTLVVKSENVAGRYQVSLYHCTSGKVKYNLEGEIVEKNSDSYLSAGTMSEPTLCISFSLIFFALGFLWLYVIKKADEVFKLHYLMLVVVWIKSLSLLLHAINLHYISANGYHAEAWTILYYVAYLIKATLLFLTIVLIGTGWIFIKQVLNKWEKKLFIVFIPLQILENIAYIIIEESVDYQSHIRWKIVFTVVDIICCLIVLVLVYWSIKHLQLAATRSDKQELILKKLKLFRHFYIIVVAYIYSTRIIIILFLISLPFYRMWISELFKEFVILTFFMLTGYTFRPYSTNPYLAVNKDNPDDVNEVLIGKPGVLDTVHKLPVRLSVQDGGNTNISYDDD